MALVILSAPDHNSIFMAFDLLPPKISISGIAFVKMQQFFHLPFSAPNPRCEGRLKSPPESNGGRARRSTASNWGNSSTIPAT
jgi:hypothetical protein